MASDEPPEMLLSEYPREWRYLRYGKVKHAFSSPSGPGAGDAPALCGTEIEWIYGAWLGTGSQQEYDECARRPKCKSCVRLLDHNPPMPKRARIQYPEP